MSIHDLSVKWAAYLARELDSNRVQENRMAFGLELFLGELIKLFLVITISTMLGILPEVLTIALTAGFLRLASGGEHCSAYYRCLIGGITCFLALGGVAHVLYPLLSRPALLITVATGSMISLALLLMYAPGDTANKPITAAEDKARFKKWSLIIAGLYFILMITMITIPLAEMLVLPMLIGMLEQTFTVTPWGYRFLHGVDRLLGNRA
ncbi:MAG: accessory gene regulator B family protein [Syntrophomonadaceae bacterium]